MTSMLFNERNDRGDAEATILCQIATSTKTTNSSIFKTWQCHDSYLFTNEHRVCISKTKSHWKGTIPSEIGQLSFLTNIDLSHNKLHEHNAITGKIPSSLGLMRNIEFIRLHNNKLTATVPSSLCVLSSLAMLYTYKNPSLRCFASCLSVIPVRNFGTNVSVCT
eukprot:gene9066-18779_t